MLCVRHTRAHSARTLSIPRNRNCRNPRACLICPNTGSTITLRAAYTALPAWVFNLRRMRSTRVAPLGSGPRGQGSLYSSCFCRSVATYPSMRPSGFSSESSASRFVAVLGASNYTFARATLSQDLGHWVECHVDFFEFWWGTPRLVVPDNPRTGVDRACRYEPDLNRTYHEMALHYGVAVMPARPRKPRDKAKVENAVRALLLTLLGTPQQHMHCRGEQCWTTYTHRRRPGGAVGAVYQTS